VVAAFSPPGLRSKKGTFAAQVPSERRRHQASGVGFPSDERQRYGVLGQPRCEGPRAVEVEDAAATRLRIQPIRESGLLSRALVQERQRPESRRETLGKASAVLLGLHFHAGQGLAELLGLDDPGGLPVHEEQVVGLSEPRLQGELADRDPARGLQIRLLPILHHPTGGFELPVDDLSGVILGTQGHVRPAATPA
jgi:hypothetical protein